ncbi:MAG: isocitrate lyase/PEP mutase family protein, partial [Mycobacteriales bacterium]
DSPETFLIARTDARATEGLDGALRRAARYVQAGADGIFIEAPLSTAELERIGREVEVPQFCNMLAGGKTPILTNQELHRMGFDMVVHGITLVTQAAKLFQQSLQAIKEDRVDYSPATTATFDEFKEIMRFHEWAEIEDRFNR